jgi:hypothetical protein
VDVLKAAFVEIGREVKQILSQVMAVVLGYQMGMPTVIAGLQFLGERDKTPNNMRDLCFWSVASSRKTGSL